MNCRDNSERVCIVLGMHKSGTSMVAGVCARAGFDMDIGEVTHVDYDRGLKGESETFQAINKALLQCGDHWSANVTRVIERGDPPREAARVATHAVRSMQEKGRPWGFKDPRTVLTYAFWEHVLPDHIVLAVYRAPEAVMARYGHQVVKTKRARVLRLHTYLYCCYRGLVAWTLYNDALLRIADRKNGVVFFRYEQLLASPQERQRLACTVGADVAGAIDPSLSRSKTVSRLVYTLCRRLVIAIQRRDPEDVRRALDGEWRRDARSAVSLTRARAEAHG